MKPKPIRIQINKTNTKVLVKALREIIRQSPVFSGLENSDIESLETLVDKLKSKLKQ